MKIEKSKLNRLECCVTLRQSRVVLDRLHHLRRLVVQKVQQDAFPNALRLHLNVAAVTNGLHKESEKTQDLLQNLPRMSVLSPYQLNAYLSVPLHPIRLLRADGRRRRAHHVRRPSGPFSDGRVDIGTSGPSHFVALHATDDHASLVTEAFAFVPIGVDGIGVAGQFEVLRAMKLPSLTLYIYLTSF